jgi:hypothetical protein
MPPPHESHHLPAAVITPTERREFVRMLSEVADEWPTERERQYLLNLPTAIGVA